MSATVVLGSQWGDEGKGKLVDILADQAQLCIRCQGGHNAGHTISVGKTVYQFHCLPSGLVNPACKNLIGSGCVVHLPQFFHELETLHKQGIDSKDRIFVSDRAHIILTLHTLVDGLEEVELGAGNIGTTRKGIGPTYSTKVARSGVRMADLHDLAYLETRVRRLANGFQKRYGDLLQYDVEKELAVLKEMATRMKPYIVDQVPFIKAAKAQNEKILVEGANAIMLDIDSGTYPFVTSSNTGVGGVITGTSLGWRCLKEVCGVVKAYTTRVGSGPFATEQLNADGEKLQVVGKEFGVTTGRKRRCGWLDLFLVKYSHEMNDYTSLMLTKLDILDDFSEIKVATSYSFQGKKLESFPAALDILENVEVHYETLPGWSKPTTGISTYDELPENAKKYVEYIEKFVGVPIKYIGTGPARDHTIVRS